MQPTSPRSQAYTLIDQAKNATNSDLMDAIRDDLSHFDPEKKARIIFAIQQHIEECKSEDTDIFHRILAIVKTIQQPARVQIPKCIALSLRAK